MNGCCFNTSFLVVLFLFYIVFITFSYYYFLFSISILATFFICTIFFPTSVANLCLLLIEVKSISLCFLHNTVLPTNPTGNSARNPAGQPAGFVRISDRFILHGISRFFTLCQLVSSKVLLDSYRLLEFVDFIGIIIFLDL